MFTLNLDLYLYEYMRYFNDVKSMEYIRDAEEGNTLFFFFNWKSALSILPPPFKTLLFEAHQNIKLKAKNAQF